MFLSVISVLLLCGFFGIGQNVHGENLQKLSFRREHNSNSKPNDIKKIMHNLKKDKSFKHHDNEETEYFLKKVHWKCEQITHLFTLDIQTVQGKNMNGIIFGKRPKQHTPLIPEFLYVSTMHGNEVLGKELLIHLIDYLCDQYTKRNKNIVKLIETTRIHILPIINPDGWQAASNPINRTAVFTNESPSNVTLGRSNYNNVDLNRNYPILTDTLFHNEIYFPWKNHHLLTDDLFTDSIQPETLAMIDYLTSTPFVLSASLHGGDVVVNYPLDAHRLPRKASYTADQEVFKEVSLAYAEAHGSMMTEVCPDYGVEGGIINGAAWYALKGGIQDFAYLATNCFMITIEVSCIKYPHESQLEYYWEENKNALIEYMWKSHMGIKGVVVDANTANPINDVVIHVLKWNGGIFEHIWHDITSNDSGDYYRLLVDGYYKVIAIKTGYELEIKMVTVANKQYEEAQIVDFILRKNNQRAKRPYNKQAYYQ